MKLSDRIKLGISRNWKFPGQIRLLNYLKPSKDSETLLNDGIIWLEGEDIGIFTTANNYIENSIIQTGTYEAEIKSVINLSLKPGAVALDIGCNIGLQSLRMSKIIGASGKVISFEPLSYLRKKSQRNFNLNLADNIQLLPYALSDKETLLEIKIDETIYNQGTFSLSQTSSGNTTEQVQVKVADHLPEIQAVHRLDLIKIDVEGFEFNVLKGLETTLLKFKPRIIFEYDENYWPRNGNSINECYAYLKFLNYEIYQISFLGCELITSCEQITDGNLYCI